MNVMEHIAFYSPLSLEEFGNKLQNLLPLDFIKNDFENETEWLIYHYNNSYEVNITRPYEEGTLQEWDDTVPPKCNFGFTIIGINENSICNCEFVLDIILPMFINAIEKIINGKAYYHRGIIMNKNIKS
ncbi:hypothetical protein [Bacillus sp. OAE603]|uniref:hypothetical protein n=1 Tax=Gottfriedia sp. OAE603 TaxID=2663872 RepID=UPI0017896F7B